MLLAQDARICKRYVSKGSIPPLGADVQLHNMPSLSFKADKHSRPLAFAWVHPDATNGTVVVQEPSSCASRSEEALRQKFDSADNSALEMCRKELAECKAELADVRKNARASAEAHDFLQNELAAACAEIEKVRALCHRAGAKVRVEQPSESKHCESHLAQELKDELKSGTLTLEQALTWLEAESAAKAKLQSKCDAYKLCIGEYKSCLSTCQTLLAQDRIQVPFLPKSCAKEKDRCELLPPSGVASVESESSSVTTARGTSATQGGNAAGKLDDGVQIQMELLQAHFVDDQPRFQRCSPRLSPDAAEEGQDSREGQTCSPMRKELGMCMQGKLTSSTSTSKTRQTSPTDITKVALFEAVPYGPVIGVCV